MDRTRFATPPRWWAPKLSPFWLRLWRPLRRRWLVTKQRVETIEVCGLEHVRTPLEQGCGVLITPNHSAHADALAMYAAADQLGRPFYFMAAWQVLGLAHWMRRLILQHHGCFSVHREGTDLKAFKCAVDILLDKPNPLVIFPEGEVYHINERVTPFRDGPAAIALTAARKGKRKIVCVPCGIRYQYIRSPLPELGPLMDELEIAMHWRPQPDQPLDQRIYRVAEGVLGLKELEYLGETRQGDLRERAKELTNIILGRLDAHYGTQTSKLTVPERVKALRQKAIQAIEAANEKEESNKQAEIDLEHLYFVIQLYSYPGDYVRERPTIDRIAETLDKFEEDVLRRQTAKIRGIRRATVTFGEPIEVVADRRDKSAVDNLTSQLEQRVQGLLDSTRALDDRSFVFPHGVAANHKSPAERST